ncbi:MULTISPECIES: 5-oxoprolinase subunit PxpB [Bacillus]|uniref:5-oxoprolinase subunit PxpB n=1 Tax=Bacillus TaxID=1386 RepID=UPI00045C3BB6|nr:MULTISPECIES: 5-oxoprolinase subunit PxpB [Bacillus]KDE29889.1 allophanate hydrolase subunit 1 [Bacillus altitudinis 41KF2b]MCA0164670.1 5-oxoprolinase subunit PxpB [Bacillus sp. RAR_M1_44]MEC1043727.1 5-oxoprolinase subunit PxpB [Bacillus altitudinis]MEC1089502.1 5-oxoprolinase subunit PxpB [Bacillus altitudinis]NOL31387.1 5-oxoprolinase subunit PxpB [Bacillus altitudinis]
MAFSTIKDTITFHPLGDAAIVIQAGTDISEDIHERVKQLFSCIEQHPFDGYVEAVQAFTNVTVFYEPYKVYQSAQLKQRAISPYEWVKDYIENLLEDNWQEANQAKRRIVDIPVCYGGELGPDLEEVARINGLTPEEVVRIHTSGTYLVYMIGFAPGFPFLGGLSEKIAAPRRETPRMSIPKGSVGIAGKQTGVYPISTPGGWQLIGQTPLSLFRPNAERPSLLKAGDEVRFVQLSEKEFFSMKEEDR